MPVQTTKGTLVAPDGARLVIKKSTQDILDVGAVNSAVGITLNYTKVKQNTANFGYTDTVIRDMQMAMSFTLINYDTEVIQALNDGILTRYATTAGTVSSIDTQTIAAGWVNEGHIPLELRETGGGHFIPSATPTIASVVASSSGTLAASDDYYIIADSDSPTGYSIYFDTTGTATVATTESIVITYTSATTLGGSSLYAGDTTEDVTAYGFYIIHRDDDGVVDFFYEIFSAEPETGFTFNIKGANEDGFQEVGVTIMGYPDTSLSSGEQLFKMVLAA